MNVNSIKINNVYHNGEVDLDALLPDAVEGLDAIKSLDENEEVLGAKNLLPLTLENLKAINTVGTWSDNVYTVNGCTYTININTIGSVTDISFNGIIETSSNHVINLNTNVALDNTKVYIMSGGDEHLIISARYVTEPYDFVNDYGGGTIVPFIRNRVVYANINEVGTYTNVKIYPMIRLASDPNSTYTPYAMGNQELTQRLLTLEQRVSALKG